MAANQNNLVADALDSFELGMNSGADAFILPRTQLAFATNCTVRGNFVTNRPRFQIQSFSFVDSSIQLPATQALFQGACYYRPYSGSETLVAQIGGRLFQFTPSAGSTDVPVVEITIPGDPNPATIQQVWMTQAERFVLVGDGLDNIVCFDGVFSRRLNSVSVKVSTVGSFAIPPLKGSVLVTASAAYAGTFNQPLQLIYYDGLTPKNILRTAIYEVTQTGSVAPSNQVILTNVSDTGATQPSGSDIVIIPARNGFTLNDIQIVGGDYRSPPSGGGNINVDVWVSTLIPLPTAGSTIILTSGSQSQSFSVFSTSSSSGHNVITIKLKTLLPSLHFPVGSLVGNSSSTPNTTVATTAAILTVPAIGATVTVNSTVAYSGSANQPVWINGAQYLISSAAVPPAASTSITIKNLNDGQPDLVFASAELWTLPELPPGRMMAYGMGRLWESLTDGISFIAGDIVGGSSGSSTYDGRDAILKVTENSYLFEGGSFRVPSNLGLITSMRFTSQPDAALGQGPLMVVTPGGIFSCNAPVERSDWQSLTIPILSEPLIGFGGLGQDSTVVINADLMFRAIDGIRSLIMAKREYFSWGNTPISFEMKRVIDADNINLLPFGSSVQFDNRMLETCTPTQGLLGVYHTGLIALNFDTISGIQGKSASVYDGLWTGLKVLKIIEGMFNGVHRCFAFTYNATENKIELVEIMKSGDGNLDNGTDPIIWSFETPMMLRDVKGKNRFELCSLEDCEFYVKDIDAGQVVDFKSEYRPDFSSDWITWHEFSFPKTAKATPVYGARLGLGKPPSGSTNNSNSTSANCGRWFQQRYTITGHCVFMGNKILASLEPQNQYATVIPKNP